MFDVPAREASLVLEECAWRLIEVDQGVDHFVEPRKILLRDCPRLCAIGAVYFERPAAQNFAFLFGRELRMTHDPLGLVECRNRIGQRTIKN